VRHQPESSTQEVLAGLVAFAEGGFNVPTMGSGPKPSTPTFGRIPFMLVSEGN